MSAIPPVPLSATLVVAAGLLLMAVSVAVSPPPSAGVYRIVIWQLLPGPRLTAEQVSATFANVAEPVSEIVSAALPDPPALVSVNAWSAWPPTSTTP
jgi:hypothetical protein